MARDIGVLAGLLLSDNGNLAFDFSWFANVASELEAVPSRPRTELLGLLSDLLGARAANAPPNAPPNRRWFALPWKGAPTPIHVVLPPDPDDKVSPVGVGILDVYTSGKTSAMTAAYIPLFALPVSDPVVVTGRANHPIELSLTMALGETVTAGSISFDGLELSCDIYFQDSAPTFSLNFLLGNKPAGSLVNTFETLRSEFVADCMKAFLAVKNVGDWLARKIGSSSFSTGDALVAAGLLTGTPNEYAFGTLPTLKDNTAEQMAETLLAAVLKLLAANENAIIPFDDGGIWVFQTPRAGGTDYGLRLQVPDADFSSADGPKITFRLGQLLAGETNDNSWISRSDPNASFPKPGVSLTVLNESGGNEPSFAPKLDVISIGLDIEGTGGKPLVNINGVTLGSIQPRFMFSLDFAHPENLVWGVGLRADGLGIPLGAGLSGANANPVAQNLLASGSANGSGDKDAVNPTFSVSVSRVFDPADKASLDVHLHSDGGSGRRIWIPVQRTFGPLQCRRVGFEWPEENPNYVLDILFDGGVKLAALAVDLQGLSVGIPLKTPGQIDNYTLDLQGMGLSYVSGPVSISGGFLKNTDKSPTEYEGAAQIQAADWALMAMGSYASLDGHPSLFIFAQLSAELGGPPFFFVTGLCAGFGYNRSLRIPTQNEVPSFPLLAGIGDPTQIGGKNAKPAEALAKLSDWIAPAQGVDWFAAGVQFTSFELVKSNVVVTAIVTGDFQAAILGVSRIKLGQSGPQFAYAELGLSVVVHPSAGFLGISAVLSPNSYVLTQDCHLTGGFAFWIWYSGDHAGDFVITLGGYHPAFKKPLHYPDEPRLGFSWQVDSNITIQGDAYFALTPSCAMGGGSLDVEFHAGDLRAWFRAHADFLFTWKPFYFIGDIGISIGASYKLDLLFTSVTISVELGADLEIWGPPTGGVVHISWFIISFSIGFGADELEPDGFRNWDEFTTLLPQKQSTKAPALKMAMAAAEVSPPPIIITPAISSGLVTTVKDASGNDDWLVRGDAMTFAVSTAFPLTTLVLKGATDKRVVSPTPGADKLAVRPMGITNVTSVMTIIVTRKADKPSDKDVVMDLSTWTSTASLQEVPVALWGPPLEEGKTPSTPSADTLPGRLVGISGLTPPVNTVTGPDPIPIVNLTYFPLDGGLGRLPLSSESAVPRQPQAKPDSVKTIAATIVAAADKRTDLFKAMAALGFDAGANGDVQAIADNASLSYAGAPMLGAPWQGTT